MPAAAKVDTREWGGNISTGMNMLVYKRSSIASLRSL